MSFGMGGGMIRGGMGGAMGPGMGRMLRAGETMDESDFGKAFDARIYGRMWHYARRFRARLAVSLILMVIYTLANVAQPYLLKIVIDRFIVARDGDGLLLMAAVYLAVSAASWLAQYGQVYLMSYVGQWTLYQLASEMFAHLQTLPLSFYDRNETGRIMARVQNDVSVLQNLLSSGIISILGNGLTLVGIIVTLFILNWKLALITYLVIPVMIVIMRVWQRYARESFRRSRAAISAVNASLQENVSGVRVIQSLSREGRNLRQFDQVNRQNLDVNVEASRVSAALLPLVEVVAAAATALVVIVGGSMVIDGALEIGALVAFTIYINTFFDPIRDLTQQYAQLQRATVAGERIFEILDTEADIKDRPDAIELPPVQGRVDFDHVDYWYTEGVPVLTDFDLHIAPGQTVALVGQTGAGKSTVVSLLSRFYEVREGALRIDGHDVRDVTLRSLRRQVGVVPQEPTLFSGTVRDNITFGYPSATDAEIEAAARAVGVHDLILRMPQGYDTPILERGVNLSMGQRQLIAFARALLANPRILVLDEATANIDTASERIIQRGLRSLLKGRTSFVIAHRLATITNADVIVVMERGRIIEQGTHTELLALGGAYHRLYTMGFQTISANPANEVAPAGDGTRPRRSTVRG